jgi:hypothetical protein
MDKWFPKKRPQEDLKQSSGPSTSQMKAVLNVLLLMSSPRKKYKKPKNWQMNLKVKKENMTSST